MDNINFAVIGTNFISDSFAEAIDKVEGARIAAVYSRAQQTGDAFAKKHSVDKVYTDLASLLNDKSIDAVYVASPTFCHKEQSIAAMRAGKHVLCEKMIALSYAEFKEMRTVSEEEGVVLLEAMRPDFDGAFDLIKAALPRLGKIRRISFDYCQYSSRYDKFKSGTVLNAFEPKLKNSALADIGIYPLHMCVSLFGEPLTISSSSVFLENGFEGAGSIIMNYGDMIAVINYSKITDNMSLSLIEGELGTLFVNKFNSPTEIFIKLRSGEKIPISFLPSENNMSYEISAFCDMIRGANNTKFLDISERTMRCIDKIYKCSGITDHF